MTKKIYKLKKYRDLLWLRGAVGSEEKPSIVMRLLVDTGSNFTVLPVAIVKQLGCDLDHPVKMTKIVTAGGMRDVPIVAIPWFNCLGLRRENFEVAALNLPVNSFTDGLLGIDFLRYSQAVIDINRGEISVNVEG
ncbi:MAG: aspartyl protease family protein [Spirulina sp.]